MSGKNSFWLSSNVNEVIRATFYFLFFLRKHFTHTYWRNIRFEDCKQSPRILGFVSMYVPTISECEDSKFESPQLGSCKYRCAYMNLVVGTSVFSTFTLRGLFSFFYFLFFTRTKSTKTLISDFFPLRCF